MVYFIFLFCILYFDTVLVGVGIKKVPYIRQSVKSTVVIRRSERTVAVPTGCENQTSESPASATRGRDRVWRWRDHDVLLRICVVFWLG